MIKNLILLYKMLIIGIIILFVGACVSPNISGYDNKSIDKLIKKASVNFPLNNGLLAYWKSDECDGTTLWDCSGHNYDGIIYADWTSGGCLNFDGIDDYVDFDNHSENLGYNITDDYMISFYFKSTSSNKSSIYSMSHTDTARAFAYLELNANGTLSYRTGDITCELAVYSNGTYNDDIWHYVEVKFYGNTTDPTLQIYVDGELDGSITDWLCPYISEDFKTAKMGKRSTTKTDYFYGIIDEFRIYKWSSVYLPPSKPVIEGPIKGNLDTKYDFTFTSTDPQDQQVSYWIDWDDRTTPVWSSFQASGTPFEANHTWTTKNTFIIKAKAKNTYGIESEMAEHTIIIPRNRVKLNSFSMRFLERFPILSRLLFL